MISQTSEYALRAVVALAVHPDKAQTTQQIAEQTKVPSNYLSKVLQSLNRAGIVASQRGLGGGSMLARPASEVTVYDVVDAVEPVTRIRSCPLGIAAHGANLCPLHRRLDNAMEQVEREFRGTTIAALLDEPGHSRPLCGMTGNGNAEPAGLRIQTGERPPSVK